MAGLGDIHSRVDLLLSDIEGPRATARWKRTEAAVISAAMCAWAGRVSTGR